MPDLRHVRTTELSSYPRESAHNFDLALHSAVRTSLQSMDELRGCVDNCVQHLKQSDIGPVEMILTMKACVRESCKRYRPAGDEEPRSNVDIIMDYVVKWAIIEFYRNPA